MIQSKRENNGLKMMENKVNASEKLRENDGEILKLGVIAMRDHAYRY